MATNRDFTLKRHNGTDIDILLPTTHVGQIYTDSTLTTTLQSVLDNKIDSSEKGAANGVATLDSSQKLDSDQIPAWLLTGTPHQVGSFSSAGLVLSAFVTTLGGLLDTEQPMSSLYGVFYQCTAAGNVTWSDGTPANTHYVVSPGDEGDTTSPITLEAGDIIVFTNYEESGSDKTYTFSVINNTYGEATTSSLGITQLSNATSVTGMSGSHVITEGVLASLVGTESGDLAAGDHTHSNYQPLDSDLTAIAGLAKTDGNIIVGNGTAWVAESGSTARSSLGLSIGSDVQAYNDTLAGIASAGPVATNKFLYTTAADTFAQGSVGSIGLDLLAATTVSGAQQALNLEVGVDVQAYDSDLSAIAGLSKADGNFIVGNGSAWITESGATARASLGVYSTTEVDGLFTNRPEIFYDTTTGSGTGDLIIDLD